MEQHIIINQDRSITVPNELKRIAVQYDHNVETVTFDCPRYWDGNDLSEMSIYINYSNKGSTTTSSYIITNVFVDGENSDMIHFDWIISRNVTNKKGKLIFSVCAKLTDDEGNEIRHWNSEINSEMYVSEGLEGSEPIEETYPDVITSFDNRITTNEQTIADMTPEYSKEDIDPVFANNSWELIKWVCQNDDPSKYWKVGDYKMLGIGEKYVGANLENDTYGPYGAPYLIGKAGQVLIPYDIDLIASLVGGKVGTYTIKTGEGGLTADPYTIEDESGEVVWGGSYRELNVNHSDIMNMADQWTLVLAKEKDEYPLQIIGFNHDKVTDPYGYGKQRAGLTLQLGCSRHQYGDTKASLFGGTINGLMTPNGYFYSPTRVKADFTLGATNWADGGFRVALQGIFKDTEIEPFMVEVQKYTSQFFYVSNQWEVPMLTADKVFILSENEMFGRQVQAPAQEGDHYEFYKDGYSKFMWHKDLLDGKTDNALLWLRSAQKSQVNENSRDSISACCCYLTVNSRDPLLVNYAPSAAGNVSEARAGLIAPCICL